MSQRERFEKWAATRCLSPTTSTDGSYRSVTTCAAWEAWQAACPDGWQTVPASPTPEMVEAAEEGHMPFGDMGFAIQCAITAAHRPGMYDRLSDIDNRADGQCRHGRCGMVNHTNKGAQMKTKPQSKYTPEQKARYRKQDQRGSRMLDIDAKREELAMARLENKGEWL